MSFKMPVYYQTYNPSLEEQSYNLEAPYPRKRRRQSPDDQDEEMEAGEKRGVQPPAKKSTRTELFELSYRFIQWARSLHIRHFKMQHEDSGETKKRRFYDVFGVVEAVGLSCRRSRLLGVWLGRNNQEIEKVADLQERLMCIRKMMTQCKTILMKIQAENQQQIQMDNRQINQIQQIRAMKLDSQFGVQNQQYLI